MKTQSVTFQKSYIFYPKNMAIELLQDKDWSVFYYVEIYRSFEEDTYQILLYTKDLYDNTPESFLIQRDSYNKEFFSFRDALKEVESILIRKKCVRLDPIFYMPDYPIGVFGNLSNILGLIQSINKETIYFVNTYFNKYSGEDSFRYKITIQNDNFDLIIYNIGSEIVTQNTFQTLREASDYLRANFDISNYIEDEGKEEKEIIEEDEISKEKDILELINQKKQSELISVSVKKSRWKSPKRFLAAIQAKIDEIDSIEFEINRLLAKREELILDTEEMYERSKNENPILMEDDQFNQDQSFNDLAF